MKINNCKLIVLILLLTIYQLLAATTVFADDKGLTTIRGISVMALVGPQPEDFQFSLADQNGATTIHQGEYHTYVVIYGALPSAKVPTNDVITVSFANDLAPNNQHIFDYQFGSASNGYGGAKPIVDLVNRTITWNISSLPAGTTDQKVYFNLFTNTYQQPNGPSSFAISLTATMHNQYCAEPDQTLIQHYSYQTPPPGPTATPGPQPTAAPTPTPTPEIPGYNVSVNDITGSNSTVQVHTANPSKVSISYGTSPGNLNQTVSTNTFQNDSTLTMTDLQPDTTYYFRITITGEDGTYYITEIFTFKTAASSAVPLNGSAVISANGTVLLSEPFSHSMSRGFALLTATFPYDVTISLPQNAMYKSLEAIVQQQPITTIEMNQQQPGIYTAHMPTLGPGTYVIVIKTLDNNGNLTEQKIADLKVIAPLSVTDKHSGTPLANARIFLWYFDHATNSFKSLPAGMFGLQENPGYTDDNGIDAITLPPGRYRAQASALFYDSATVDFTLGKYDGEAFPHIQLQKNPTNIIALLMVIKDYLMDNLISAFTALKIIATSSHVFHVVATATIGFLILMTYLFFLLKSHTSLKNLPLLLFIFIDVVLKRHKGKYLFGKVTDADGLPLSLVRVEVEDAQSKAILRHTTTNKTGKFYFMNKFQSRINLLFMKEGFQPESRSLPTDGFPEKGLTIVLETGEVHHSSALVILCRSFRDILGMLFETTLVLSVIIEIAFFFFYGFAKTAPFLILSVINILLWLVYIHQRSEKSVL